MNSYYYNNYYNFNEDVGGDIETMYDYHERKNGFYRKRSVLDFDDCFPILKTDGGTLDNLEDLKNILRIHKSKVLDIATTYLLDENLLDTFDEDDIEIIKKHILYCIKVADNPNIYKKIAKQQNWKYND